MCKTRRTEALGFGPKCKKCFCLVIICKWERSHSILFTDSKSESTFNLNQPQNHVSLNKPVCPHRALKPPYLEQRVPAQVRDQRFRTVRFVNDHQTVLS